MKKILSLCLAASGLFVGTCYANDNSMNYQNQELSTTQEQNTDSQDQLAYSDMSGQGIVRDGQRPVAAYGEGSVVGSRLAARAAGDVPAYSGADQSYAGQEFSCGQPFEHPCGDSYQLYCSYTPCYYNEWRTVCEPQCYQKKCCRMVTKEYDKCCVKYVPQYYTQKCTRCEPEYFYTTETKEVSRKVCDRKCKWVPKYYYKHICQPACPTACP